MARKNSNAQLWSDLSAVGVGRNKGAPFASTTLTAATLANAATFPVAATTDLAANDIVRIGTGNLMEIAVVSSIAALVVTPVHVLEFAHASGEVVVEQAKTDLGPMTDDGVSTDAEGDFNAIMAGTKRMVWAFNGGHYAPMFDFILLDFALENLALAYGMKETDITGSGTAAVPKRLVANPAKFGLDLDQWFYFTGVHHDTLTNLEAQLWAVEIDWSAAGKHKFIRGQPPASIPVKARCTSAISWQQWS